MSGLASAITKNNEVWGVGLNFMEDGHLYANGYHLTIKENVTVQNHISLYGGSYNGADVNINANAFVIFDGEAEKTSPEHTTTMHETIVAVNTMTTLSAGQKAAVYSLYEKYADIMAGWLGEDNNIAKWSEA